jgi:hypothetical protein
MGVREMLAYGKQAVMSVRQFIELCIKESPADAPYEVADLLAQLIAAERSTIEIPGKTAKFDWLRDDIAESRNKLRQKTIADLHAMTGASSGIESAPDTLLNREGLLTAFAKLGYETPRFLRPPAVWDQPAPASAIAPAVHEPDCQHSDDFSSVRWFGAEYCFTPTQAKAVALLWAEWERGGLGLKQQTIGEMIDSSSNRFELRTLFRNHPAWGQMIHPAERRGVYRLGPPPA